MEPPTTLDGVMALVDNIEEHGTIHKFYQKSNTFRSRIRDWRKKSMVSYEKSRCDYLTQLERTKAACANEQREYEVWHALSMIASTAGTMDAKQRHTVRKGMEYRQKRAEALSLRKRCLESQLRIVNDQIAEESPLLLLPVVSPTSPQKLHTKTTHTVRSPARTFQSIAGTAATVVSA
jgi:hypothetical protein